MKDKLPMWGVAIIDLNATGLYLLERLSQRSDVRVVEVYDRDPQRLVLAEDRGCKLGNHPHAPVGATGADTIFFMGEVAPDDVATALMKGKHVVIGQPWRLSSDLLSLLEERTHSSTGTATFACLHRWSPDFVAPLTAKASGRLGTIATARRTSCETNLAPDNSFKGALREFGFHWLDQLLLLVESRPSQVFARRFFETRHKPDSGLWMTIEFENGCTAQLDLQTQSLLSYRTGWMLEGSSGSYRGNRLYTKTSDGEIIDEPQPSASVLEDPFIDQLVSLWKGKPSELPSLSDAACVVKMIEVIEQSSASGDATSLLPAEFPIAWKSPSNC